jgi:ParE toxin of type II toxin-antitoxin system, parDE
MKARLVSSAKEDLRRLSSYYDSVRLDFGDVFSDRVTEFVQRIRLHPQLYAAVNRPPRGRDVREGVLEQFDQIVVTYEVRATEIVILAITDGKRKRRPWRNRLSEI